MEVVVRVMLTSDLHRGYSRRTSKVHREWATRIASEPFDVLAVAGDLGTSRQWHTEACLRFLRDLAGIRPVVVVMGNHDYWDRKIHNIHYTIAKHREWCADSKIHYLGDGPLTLDGVTFVGWDGWYHEYGYTNDPNHIPSGAADALRRREQEQLQAALDAASAAAPFPVVGVTHFPCVPGLPGRHYDANPAHWQFLPGRLDVLCMGHSHRRVDGLILEGVRLYNAGSDYDRPNHVCFEV